MTESAGPPGTHASIKFDVAVATAALLITTATVNLQMPLYRVYAAAGGYGNGVTTLVFAAYVAGLIPTLLFFGGLSDRIGRKPVMCAGVAAATAATILMIAAPRIETLFVTRIFQGVGVGLSMGSASAYLSERLDADRGSRAASYVTFATSLGFGGGALMTGTLLLFGPTDRPPSYLIVSAAGILCLCALVRVRASSPVGGSVMRLPHFAKGTFPANASIATAWAVTGVVISLLPAQLARHGLSAWAGHALFLVNGTGALLQSRARRMSAARSLRVGFLLLPIGYTFLVLGAWSGSLLLVLCGASLAGSACYGFTYLGGLAVVNQVSRENRARSISGYFLFAYLGLGLPSVVLGFAADRVGLIPALGSFGVVVLLACAALALGTRTPEDTPLQGTVQQGRI